MATNQDLLDNAREALNNILLMDGVEEYSTQEKRYRAQRITEIKNLIFDLENRIAASAGGGARLVKPIEEVA